MGNVIVKIKEIESHEAYQSPQPRNQMLGYIAAPLPSQVSLETVLLTSCTEQQIYAPRKNNGIKRQIRSLSVVTIIM